MNELKNRTISLIQGAILTLNSVAVISIAAFIYITTERIRASYDARKFIGVVNAIPENPEKNLYLCIILVALIWLNSIVRRYLKEHEKNIFLTLLVDFMACVGITYVLNFNYNGILLLFCANVLLFVKNQKEKMLYIVMTIFTYLITDYNLLSFRMPLYSIQDYISYYNFSMQQYILSVYDIAISLNIILFIVYCIYVIRIQSGTIEEVNMLYKELQIANEQLQEYLAMSERMAQTKERNRLAREIHDTLGHTLTGIATGLDAALAMMDVAPAQTRQQLELLSKVSRDGIKEVRRSVNELRPDALERLSLKVAIETMIEEISRISDVEISFETDENKLIFDEDEEIVIYRVVQESMTNAIRHGHATKVWITLKRTNREVILTIKDNGCGCKNITEGFGIKHIKERIEMLKGTVHFDGSDGFTVTAHIQIRWGEAYD